MNRRTFLLEACLVGALSAVCLPANLALAEEPLKVAFVYVGPVGDAGWTYAHDQGRQALEKAFGSKVKTTFVESVPEGADGRAWPSGQLVMDGTKSSSPPPSAT
jgi:simple sugar transport system substrate-binding protein